MNELKNSPEQLIKFTVQIQNKREKEWKVFRLFKKFMMNPVKF